MHLWMDEYYNMKDRILDSSPQLQLPDHSAQDMIGYQ